MDKVTQEITKAKKISHQDLIAELRELGSLSGDNEKCSVCQENFLSYENNIVFLSRCKGHYFHDICISNCRQGNGFIKCPNCMKVYGVQTGNMPSGTMAVQRVPKGIPGFQCSHHFMITYNVQSVEIKREIYAGANRIAYLPDTTEGRHALTLLTTAFHRGLTFTPSVSVTTGKKCVTWAIHHKTYISDSTYGYPDSTYLQRLTEELNARGVNFIS